MAEVIGDRVTSAGLRNAPFGCDAANELVTWFNTVDATYRADINRLNDLNFQRFEATLKQALAEFLPQAVAD
jgi:hypothetical protein